MLERLGITERDRRNLLIVAGVIGLTIAVLTDQRIGVRILSGVIGGAIAGVVFLVTTVLIKKAGLTY